MANVEGKATAITVLTPVQRGGPLVLSAVFPPARSRGHRRSASASIARQFEFIQSQWFNRGNAFTLGEDQDLMLGPQDGPPPRKMTVPGNPPFFVGPLRRLVTVRGGEYFFVPGVNGLQFLASVAGGEGR